MTETRVKICGITRVEDARAAVEAGADAIGLVFYPPSPRNIDDLDLARQIAEQAGPFVSVVALFVDPQADFVTRVLSSVNINLLQFHGSETENLCRRFGRPYIKALRMKPDIDISSAMEAYESASGILLDTYREGVPGGTGEVFNWARVPQESFKPVIVAGGLTPSNVADAIKNTRPYAVDVSGGVEQAPGEKSDGKIRAFIAAARSAK